MHPALGLSLLQAALTRHGITSQIEYLNLAYLTEVGLEFYETVGGKAAEWLVGDWIFSKDLAPSTARKAGLYGTTFLEPLGREFAIQAVRERERAGDFIERAVERILAGRPRIVGFTSAYQQHIASLALAKRLKEQDPALTLLFGGANCEAAMGAETLRQFPFLDAVVSGEGDLVIVDLVERILAGRSYDDLPGVYTQENVERAFADGCPTAPSVTAMDELPYPTFHNFFEQLAGLPEKHAVDPRLLFETSRGCWWGQKHHCTFCGLNGSTMRYRSKSAGRAMDELQWLVDTYPSTVVLVVDNILDMGYFRDFIPELTRRRLGLHFHYEVKANLSKAQLRELRAAGIAALQPGIESLSTEVLKLMDKGVRGLQNVQLLKWCKELGVTVHWNVLWGFPGETSEEYATMAELVPKIVHLQPPIRVGAFNLDRFSPNFVRAVEIGFTSLRPTQPYSFVYDLDETALRNIAYNFDFDYAVPRDLGGYTAPLASAIDAWKAVHGQSEVIAIDYGSVLLIVDDRKGLPGGSRVLSGLDRELYLKCDGICGIAQLQALAQSSGEPATRQDMEARLQPLLDAGLMLREGDAYLSLAITLGDYVPTGALKERLQSMAFLEPALSAAVQ